MTKRHYHYTMHITEETYKELQELSKYLTSPEFEAIKINVLPEDLIPKHLHEVFKTFMLKTIASLRNLSKDTTH